MDKTARRLLQVLELFRREQARSGAKREKFGVNSLEVFFVIADKDDDEGITVSAIADRLEIVQSVASRNIAVLSNTHYSGGRGLDIVTVVRDPYDRRCQIVRLSPEGKRLSKRIKEIME
jgi:DNA-binding MarR family transcriptional regulator